MKTKRIVLLFIAVLALLPSCKENDDLLVFSDSDAYVYFALPFVKNVYGGLTNTRTDSLEYSFAWDKDIHASEYAFSIPVNISGLASDKDRKFTIQIIENETTAVSDVDYEPFAETYTLEAGKFSTSISVKVFKTKNIANESRQIKIKLVPSDDFELGYRENLTAKLIFSNTLLQPDWWKTWVKAFGNYSKEKYQVWIMIYPEGADHTLDAKGNPYYWGNMPNIAYEVSFPITYLFKKKAQNYLLENVIYEDNDPSKDRVLIP